MRWALTRPPAALSRGEKGNRSGSVAGWKRRGLRPPDRIRWWGFLTGGHRAVEAPRRPELADPDFDPAPAAPVRLRDFRPADHQRLVVNPFLAVFLLVLW